MLGGKTKQDKDVRVTELRRKDVLSTEFGLARATSVERSKGRAGISHTDVWGQCVKGNRKRSTWVLRRKWLRGERAKVSTVE